MANGNDLVDPHGLKDRTLATVRLALILQGAAMELWEIAASQDAADMWDEARAVASRILSSCMHSQ